MSDTLEKINKKRIVSYVIGYGLTLLYSMIYNNASPLFMKVVDRRFGNLYLLEYFLICAAVLGSHFYLKRKGKIPTGESSKEKLREKIYILIDPLNFLLLFFSNYIILSLYYTPLEIGQHPDGTILLRTIAILMTPVFLGLRLRGVSAAVLGFAWALFFTSVFFTIIYVKSPMGDFLLLPILLYLVAREVDFSDSSLWRRKRLIPIYLLFILTALNPIFAFSEYYSIWGVYHFINGILFFFLVYGNRELREKPEQIGKIVLIVTLPFLSYYVIYYIKYLSSNISPEIYFFKWFIGYSHANAVGGFLTVAIPFIYIFFRENTRRFFNVVIFILLLYTVTLLILVESRGAILAQIPAVFIIVYYELQRRKSKIRFPLPVGIAFPLVILLGVVVLFFTSGIHVNNIKENSFLPSSFQIRFLIWDILKEVFAQNSWATNLFGFGFKHTDLVISYDMGKSDLLGKFLLGTIFQDSGSIHSHNLFFEMLISGGLVFLVLFILIIIISTGLVLLRGSGGKHVPIKLASLASLVALLVHGNAEYLLNDPFIIMIFWVCIGVLLSDSSDAIKGYFKDKPLPSSLIRGVVFTLAILTIAAPYLYPKQELPFWRVMGTVLKSGAYKFNCIQGVRFAPNLEDDPKPGFIKGVKDLDEMLDPVIDIFPLRTQNIFLAGSIKEVLYNLTGEKKYFDDSIRVYKKCSASAYAAGAMCDYALYNMLKDINSAEAKTHLKRARQRDPIIIQKDRVPVDGNKCG